MHQTKPAPSPTRADDSSAVNDATDTGISSKKRIALDATMRAVDAARAIHRSLIDTVERSEAGVRDGLDPECLHDFRVAVHRARSALAQVKGVFAPATVAHLKTELKWLQTATGPVRDLDVYLLNMAKYREDLPEPVRADIDPLETYLRNHHAIERRRLLSVLDSDRYHLLLDRWRALAAPDQPVDPEAPNAERSIDTLAGERIWRAYKRVRKAGDAITADTPDDRLHALRIECKKLRYLLEFFAALFGEKKVGRLVTSLRVLQDNLGDFNDLSVQQRQLTEFAHDMVREQHVGADSLLAMGRLVEHLSARQALERRRFERSYAEFARRRIKSRFRRLFRGRTRRA